MKLSSIDLNVLVTRNMSHEKFIGRLRRYILALIVIIYQSDFDTVVIQVASALIKEDKFHQLKNCKIIVSTYLDSFTALLEDPSLLVAEMTSTGADIIKFVWEASNITEIATAFDLMSNSQV